MLRPQPLVDGVWWLRGTRGCNVYVARLPDGSFALVDSGAPGSAEPIVQALKALGAPPGQVRLLLLTHGHWDHAGGAAALRTRLGLRVAAGAGDLGEGGRLRSPRGRRRLLPTPVQVDLALPMECEGSTAPGVVSIPAPGHTAGSTCYLLPERGLLFLGDVALHSGSRMSRPLSIANEDSAVQERTLQSLAARAPANGAPGHGPPIVGGFDRMLRELAARPPARGPWWLRVLLNWRALAQFVRRGLGGA